MLFENRNKVDARERDEGITRFHAASGLQRVDSGLIGFPAYRDMVDEAQGDVGGEALRSIFANQHWDPVRPGQRPAGTKRA